MGFKQSGLPGDTVYYFTFETIKILRRSSPEWTLYTLERKTLHNYKMFLQKKTI